MTDTTRPDYSDIGDRIARLRSHLGMTRPEFARENGFTPSQLANWEYGLRRISVDAALRLNERYSVSLDWVFLGRLSALPHSLASALADRPEPKAQSRSTD